MIRNSSVTFTCLLALWAATAFAISSGNSIRGMKLTDNQIVSDCPRICAPIACRNASCSGYDHATCVVDVCGCNARFLITKIDEQDGENEEVIMAPTQLVDVTELCGKNRTKQPVLQRNVPNDAESLEQDEVPVRPDGGSASTDSAALNSTSPDASVESVNLDNSATELASNGSAASLTSSNSVNPANFTETPLRIIGLPSQPALPSDVVSEAVIGQGPTAAIIATAESGADLGQTQMVMYPNGPPQELVEPQQLTVMAQRQPYRVPYSYLGLFKQLGFGPGGFFDFGGLFNRDMSEAVPFARTGNLTMLQDKLPEEVAAENEEEKDSESSKETEHEHEEHPQNATAPEKEGNSTDGPEHETEENSESSEDDQDDDSSQNSTFRDNRTESIKSHSTRNVDDENFMNEESLEAEDETIPESTDSEGETEEEEGETEEVTVTSTTTVQPTTERAKAFVDTQNFQGFNTRNVFQSGSPPQCERLCLRRWPRRSRGSSGGNRNRNRLNGGMGGCFRCLQFFSQQTPF